MGWLKNLGAIGGTILGGPVGGFAGGLIGSQIGNLFGKDKKNSGFQMPDAGMIDQLSVSDAAVSGITDNVTRNANTTLAQMMNKNNDIVAKGNLSPQAEAALNRGAGINAAGAVSNATADLGFQQQVSRNEAIRFLLGLQQRKDQLQANKDSELYGMLGNLGSAGIQLLGSKS